jgi:DNA-binding SARP family transcriptional activator
MQGSSLELPSGYYLEREPDLLVLRRLDGSMVGAFSARGAAPEAVQRTLRRTFENTLEETSRGESAIDRREGSVSIADQPSLRVRFFGHFEVLCDDEVITLGRSGKALTILKYLLANRARPVSQDHLMGWLWPESNLKKARWSLNSAIHGLRKLLSECSASGSPNYVVLEEGYYRLCPDIRVTTDVDEFDAHYEEGRRLEKANRTEEAAAEYEEAIALYRGEYLVEDLYEDWTMVERERLSNAYIDMLWRLAVHYYETEQCQESIRACYRVLEKDRCHEDSYRLLMRCYARLGLRGRALRQYRLCERILKQEYGTAPSPETRALYRSLLSKHH